MNRLTPLEQLLFARTLTHPVLAPFIEWVSPRWLAEMSNPEPKETTDLGNWRVDEPRVNWDELYANILKQGMRDPFLVGVGRVTRRVRLEAGNQRVQCMLIHGIEAVPAVAFVGDSSITHPLNGTHEGRLLPLKIATQVDIMGPYAIREYARLSDVLVAPPLVR